MTNTEETLTEVAVEEEVQALNTQPSGRVPRHIDDTADRVLSEFHERAISEVKVWLDYRQTCLLTSIW